MRQLDFLSLARPWASVLLLCCCLIPQPSRSQDASAWSEKVGAYLDGDGRPMLNGVVLVSDGSGSRYLEAWGWEDFALRTPMRRDSVFPIASVAKPFTATAVLQLWDAGLVHLDDPVHRHIREFPFAGITLRHLLSHTSGLPDLELFEPVVAQNPDVRIGTPEMLRALELWDQALPTPGDAFRYSNVNYQLLAEVVARVSGLSFPRYMRERVFDPAGMTSTYVLGDETRNATPVRRHVFATFWQDEPVDLTTLDLADPVRMRPFRYEVGNLGHTVGDQNVFTTAEDLARFDRALSTNIILSAASQAEAYTPARLNDGGTYLDTQVYELYGTRCGYGLGFEVCDHERFGRLIGHGGFSRGIQVLFVRNLDHGHLVVAFDNADVSRFAPIVSSLNQILNDEPANNFIRRRSLTRAFGASLLREGPGAAFARLDRHRADETWVLTKDGLNELGYDFLRNGHPEKAIVTFQTNLALHPGQPPLIDSLAEALEQAGDVHGARDLWRRALEIDATHADSLSGFARTDD